MIRSDDIIKFFQNELGVATNDLDEDTLLFSSGVIDSFSLVSLLTFLEQRGGFEVDPDEIILENLDSVRRILSFASKKIGHDE